MRESASIRVTGAYANPEAADQGGGFLLLCRWGSETQQKSFCDMTDKEKRIPGKTDRKSFTGHSTGREEGEIKAERKSQLIPYEVDNTISFSVCVCGEAAAGDSF